MLTLYPTPLSLPFPPLLVGFYLVSYFPCTHLRALSNLSVLFYLPEGECFWITGLINKVNTDHQPLTQHCADRGEKHRSLTESETKLWVKVPPPPPLHPPAQDKAFKSLYQIAEVDSSFERSCDRFI